MGGVRGWFADVRIVSLLRGFCLPDLIMTDETNVRAKPAPPEGPVTTLQYLAALLLAPLVVLWRQDNILFTGPGFLSPWAYFGFFRNLLEFKGRFKGSAAGARLSWILPGAAVHKLLPPLAASYGLHFSLHTLASLFLFLTLKWVVGARRAFLAAMLFSLNPYLSWAAGWDDVDGIAIVYCLLTMTLLTWAALAPQRRWPLLAGGMSFAAIVYCNSDWMVLFLLPLYYVVLVYTWHRIPLARSLLVLCGWFGAGCVIVTVGFSVTNKILEGSFLSFAAPVLELLHVRHPQPWWSGLWLDGAPTPWLLFLAAACFAAARILLSERRDAGHRLTPEAVLSCQFLFALAWTIVEQLRGLSLLGLPYDASILLPFGFLVIGSRFWRELDNVSSRNYRFFCLVMAAVLGYAWLDSGMNWIGSPPIPAWLGLVGVLASLLLRQFPENVIAALVGFFVFTAMGVSLTYGFGTDPHAFRHQFEVVSQARERVESVRRGQAVRFWYDQQDPANRYGMALASSYNGSDSFLSQSFGKPPCDHPPAPATVVAVLAADRLHGPDFVFSMLAPCWNKAGLRILPIETDTYRQGSMDVVMSLLQVAAVPPNRSAAVSPELTVHRRSSALAGPRGDRGKPVY